MNMTRRAYAASLNLAKADARGRMSAEAHEAIALAESNGTVFSDSAAQARVKVVKAAPKAGEFDARKVREWAKSKGLTVNARGRLSAEVLAAFKADNPEVAPAAPGTLVKVVGKDIRPTAPRRRPAGTEYTAVDRKGKHWTFSEREACKCGASLMYCRCGSPVVLGMDVTVRTR